MGQLNYNPVEPRGSKNVDEYLSYLANLYAMNHDELVSLLEGRLSSINIREIAGFLVDLLTLKHKSGLVGMSAEDPQNPDAVRFWAGDADKETAPFRVLQKGLMIAVGALIMSATGYPRLELNGGANLLAAYKSLEEYIAINPSLTGNPTLQFKNASVEALLSIIGTNFSMLTTPGDISINAQTGTLRLSGNQVLVSGGFTGTFTAGAQTVTVKGGIITSVV